MKNILIILIPVLILGCSLTNDEANITFTVPESRSATAISDLGSVKEIQLYISNVGENFIMSDDTILYGDSSVLEYTQSNGTKIENIDGEDVPITDSETGETSTVWIKSIENSNTLSFQISYGLTKVFTVKVTYEDGEIFIGSDTRTINSLTTNIDIKIRQTSSSIADSTFNEIEEFLQNDLE